MIREEQQSTLNMYIKSMKKHRGCVVSSTLQMCLHPHREDALLSLEEDRTSLPPS